jgi:hypothetical protein
MKPVIGERQVASSENGRDDVVEFLERSGPVGSFRIRPTDEFQSNRYAGFAIASLGGAHAAKTRLIQDLFEAGGESNPHWLRLLNVRFVVSRQGIDSIPGMRRVYRGSGNVFEIPDWLPRATVVGEYRVAKPPSAILDSVAQGSRDAARVTWLERDPGLALGSASGATATITSYRLNDLEIEVSTPGAALLRLADLWYPDWEATVDGRPTQILKADYLLRAVAVPPGTHRVAFHFRPRAMRQGLLLSCVSLLVTLALLAAGLLRRRPVAPAAGAA